MPKIVFYSHTGQTRKFIDKIKNFDKIEISSKKYDFNMDSDFILVMPSYEENVLPSVIKTARLFLERKNNISRCKGIFGSGNRNFAKTFCITAKSLSEEYNIPLLHELEFQGDSEDVKKLELELNKFD